MWRTTFSEDHSIFYYLLLLVLVGAVLQALVIGGLFFFKRTGDGRSNAFYGTLLILFGLTLLHYIFIFTDFYESYRTLYFLPIYFTLSFPMLLFYHVKLNMYPQYKMRFSDIKHFILPIGQFLFFLVLFSCDVDYKWRFDRWFYNPFYGAFEQFLYIVLFFAYTYFAYRYVQRKRKQVKDRSEYKKVLYARKLLRLLFFLFCVHTLFLLSDFVSYNFLAINLRSIKVYAALGILSFTALLMWLGTYGFQLLLWGRKVLYS